MDILPRQAETRRAFLAKAQGRKGKLNAGFNKNPKPCFLFYPVSFCGLCVFAGK
jgi:hypothetical protein